MTLYFEEEGDVKLPLECESLAKRVVEECQNKDKIEMSYAEVIREECNIIENFPCQIAEFFHWEILTIDAFKICFPPLYIKSQCMINLFPDTPIAKCRSRLIPASLNHPFRIEDQTVHIKYQRLHFSHQNSIPFPMASFR